MMPKIFKTYIAHFFCLLLAFHFLNLSVDIPSGNANSANSFSIIGSAAVENLLAIILDVNFEIYETAASDNYEKELEKESTTELTDILSHYHQRLGFSNQFRSSLLNLHKPCYNLKDRAQEITPPPPKPSFFLQRLYKKLS